MKNCIISIVLFIIIQGCFPNFRSTEKDRLYLKEVSGTNLKLEWFFYSTISNTTPDYLIAHQEDEADTICIADNIATIEIVGSKIKIGFYGTPKYFDRPILISPKVFNFDIVIDSSKVQNDIHVRNYYKK